MSRGFKWIAHQPACGDIGGTSYFSFLADSIGALQPRPSKRKGQEQTKSPALRLSRPKLRPPTQSLMSKTTNLRRKASGSAGRLSLHLSQSPVQLWVRESCPCSPIFFQLAPATGSLPPRRLELSAWQPIMARAQSSSVDKSTSDRAGIASLASMPAEI